MPSTISPEQRQASKRQIIELVEQGASVQQARNQSEVPMHRATVYRLLKRVRTQGEAGYSDGVNGSTKHLLACLMDAVSVLLSVCLVAFFLR